MADRFPHPKFRSFLADGTPNALGKVYVYQTGTTTKTNSYTDRAAQSANANPVILDSAGEGNIWLPQGAQYTIKIDTAADVQLTSTDGISASDLALWVATSSDIYFNAGQVFIGSTTGSEDLTVVGTASVSSTLAVTGILTASGGVSMGDSVKSIYGTGNDADILYDGTDLIINPKAAGSGEVNVSGNLEAVSLSTNGAETFTYDEGTYTGTFTGFSTTPTPTVKYVRIGKMVTITIPQTTATSNATGWTITGAPAAIRPSAIIPQGIFPAAYDNTAIQQTSVCAMGTDGILSLFHWTGSAYGNWTASGTKGFSANDFTFTYPLY